jgi:rod shape-determining protein MreD
MITILLQTAFILLLAILQITFLKFFSIGSVIIDATFAFVIYSGLWSGTVRGAFLSFTLGFFLDCLSSPIWGLHMFSYVLFFYISTVTSAKINRENRLLLSLFTGTCLLVQGALKILFYWLILDVDILYTIPTIFFPQAVAMGILSTYLFNAFSYFEVLLNAEVRQPARRL